MEIYFTAQVITTTLPFTLAETSPTLSKQLKQQFQATETGKMTMLV